MKNVPKVQNAMHLIRARTLFLVLKGNPFKAKDLTNRFLTYKMVQVK